MEKKNDNMYFRIPREAGFKLKAKNTYPKEQV